MINLSFQNAKILIVNDQENGINLLLEFMDIEGYTNISSATNLRQTIEMYRSVNPDIILLDLMTPFFKGLEILQQLKGLIPDNSFLPIIVFKDDITNETYQKALLNGATDFVSKPFDFFELGLRIKNLLYAHYLFKLQENHNQILEETVKKRTKMLEQINSDLSAAKEKAEVNDRMKSAFINNITHEIRTPLTSIIGFGQLMAESDLDIEERNELFDVIKESSNRLINTVTDILDISILISGNQDVAIKSFNIYSIFETIFNKLLHKAQSKGLTFEMDQSIDKELDIVSDPILIAKVISALLDNSIKFTKKGGILFGYENQNDQLIFYVKDTGVGIEKDIQKKIFDPFVQESISNTRGYEGNGLGLTISRQIVNLFGGRIWFDSVTGRGSNFYFSIPLEE